MSNYYRIGYVVDRYLEQVTAEDLQILTHINIAFGHVENGKIKTSHLKNMNQISRLRALNPRIKILLSVGGWTAGGFSAAAATVEGCEKFARSGLETYERFGLDGIDIDWEYPCSGSAGIDYSSNDKYTFTVMLEKLRKALPDGAMLTIAAGAGDYFIEGTEMDKVAEYLDYVQLMTYDMCWGKTAVHHTNLYQADGDSRQSSADYSVDIFNKAGVPLGKLILGAAFYSRDWKGMQASDSNGLYQVTEDNAGFGPGYTTLHEEYINKNGYTRFWDDCAKAPYLFNGSHFISYDDEDSIACKCEYIKQKGIKGIMYWEHSCDPSRILLNAIGKNL